MGLMLNLVGMGMHPVFSPYVNHDVTLLMLSHSFPHVGRHGWRTNLAAAAAAASNTNAMAVHHQHHHQLQQQHLQEQQQPQHSFYNSSGNQQQMMMMMPVQDAGTSLELTLRAPYM